MRIHIKVHAIARYLERIDGNYEHLNIYRKRHCKECLSLHEALRHYATNNKNEWAAKLRALVADATEEKSYINDTNFMSYYYEKYGYDRKFKFLINGNVLFVALIENGDMHIVTCMHPSWYNVSNKKKYKKSSQLTSSEKGID